MKLFLDTEFADPDARELVSLALVSEDGNQVFYAERDPLPLFATAFVRQHVYPLLDRGRAAMYDNLFSATLCAFLERVEDPHII
jgi:hypothetical protein